MRGGMQTHGKEPDALTRLGMNARTQGAEEGTEGRGSTSERLLENIQTASLSIGRMKLARRRWRLKG
jgi:hypothetical protein